MADTDRPDFLDPRLAAMTPLWEKAADCYSGLYSSDLKRKWLPIKTMEPDDAYNVRVTMAIAPKDFEDAVNDNAALLSDFTILDGTPESFQLEERQRNIDLMGNSLIEFLQKCDISALNFDACFVLVERSSDPMPDSNLEVVENPRVPHLALISLRDVCSWQEAMINGVKRLTRLVVKRSLYQPKGGTSYENELVEEYWEYQPGFVIVHTKDSKGEISSGEPIPYLDSTGQPLREIPVVWYSVSGAPCLGSSTPDGNLPLNAPPFMSLAERVLWQFRQESELDDTLDKTNHPTPVREWPGRIPDNPPDLVLGSNSVIEATTGCKVYPFEISASGVSLTADRIERSRAIMRELARSFVGANHEGKTATESLIELGSAKATIKGVARRKESMVQEILRYWCMYTGEVPTGGIRVSDTILRPTPSAQDVAVIIQGFVQGLFDRPIALQKLQEIGWLPDDADPMAMMSAIAPTEPLNGNNQPLGL